MKVLFLSESPVNRQVSIGNTFLNVFDCIDDVELSSIYLRNGMPDARRIRNAFRISDKRLVRYCFSPKKIGERIDVSSVSEGENDNRLETFTKQKRPPLFFFMRTCLWKLIAWKKSGINDFLDEIEPDVIFTLLTHSIILNNIILYVKKRTNARLFIYAWDDTYGYEARGSGLLAKLCHSVRRRKMRRVVAEADKMYVISEVQKQDYEKAFSRECKILTKSSDFSMSPEPKTEHEKPLKMLYTGNLALGRWETLSAVTDALKDINKSEKLAVLDVYTATPLTDKQTESFADGENTLNHGRVSSDQVNELQKQADILVFCEGFSDEAKKLVRQSFSTKLVDYFKAALPILAVGPKEVASIKHLKDNDAAAVCTDIGEVRDTLERLLSDGSYRKEYALKGYNCGRRYHSSEVMTEMLLNDLNETANA